VHKENMKTKTNLLMALAAFLCSGSAGFGQGSSSTNVPSTTSTAAVFRVSFAAVCQAFDSTRGRVVPRRLTEKNIIAQAVGGSPADQTLLQNFALAYNAAEDSLQVVDTNLQPVVDVIHFGGGAAIADNRQVVRFTFLFFPGQTNELGAETNVLGSAVITERTNQLRHASATNGPNITGRLQFLLTGGNLLGMTNPFVLSGLTNSGATTNTATSTNAASVVAVTNNQGLFTNFLSSGNFVLTNANIVFDPSAQICVGVFTTARPVPGTTPPSAPLGTNTNTVSTTNTTTGVASPPSGTTGTNGTTAGSTNIGTGTVIGFNVNTGTVITNNGAANIGAGAAGSVPGTPGLGGAGGTGAIGTTITPGVTGTTGLGTASGATLTGSGAGTTGTTAGSGTITTGAGTSGVGPLPIVTGAGSTTGLGAIGAGTSGVGTTGTTNGRPISPAF
jgi:hypothetical protein